MIIARVRKITNYNLGVYLGCNKEECCEKERYILDILNTDNNEDMLILLCETHFWEFMSAGGAIPKESLN